MMNRRCPRCGNNYIIYQREQVGTVGGNMHHFSGPARHRIMYWLFIGWWVWMFKLLFELFRWSIVICTFGLVGRKKNKGMNGRTISASKSINRTVAVCQNCGYTWYV